LGHNDWVRVTGLTLMLRFILIMPWWAESGPKVLVAYCEIT